MGYRKPLGGLCFAFLIDARAGVVRRHIVAAEEAGLRRNVKANDELVALVDGIIALRICFGATPVLGEVEVGHADFLPRDGGPCAHGVIVVCPFLVGAVVLVGLQRNAARARTGRQREVRRNNILHDRGAAQFRV